MNSKTETETAQPATQKTKRLKQAVVVIHGMGEQRPMETIRNFVRNVWMKDTNLKEPHFWSKPSSVSYSFEQRRLTTNDPAINGKDDEKVLRTDFYEYYWAFQTVGTTWEHFTGWISQFLFCLPNRYGRHKAKLLQVWALFWILLIVAAGLIGIWLWFVVPMFKTCLIGGIVITVVEGVALHYLNKARRVLTTYFGDVARYVEAEPCNIRIRQAVRSGGIELIERIQQTGDYERIVLVGHSLGTIVAYDILNHLWGRHNKFTYQESGVEKSRGLSDEAIKLINRLKSKAENIGKKAKNENADPKKKDKDVESSKKDETDLFDQTGYRNIQSELFKELRDNDTANNWLISDFITLGSPLTYADLVLFKDNQKFTLRKLDREYPTSPPVDENGQYYYQAGGKSYLHHGAVFAPVKWTNIYCPSTFISTGDIISGPVSRNFSYIKREKDHLIPVEDDCKTPILEIKLSADEMGGGFTHTKYWKSIETEGSENSADSESSEDTENAEDNKNSGGTHLERLRESLGLY